MQREADELVDLVLADDAVGAGEIRRILVDAVVDHGGPFGRHGVGLRRRSLFGKSRAPFVGELAVGRVGARRAPCSASAAAQSSSEA